MPYDKLMNFFLTRRVLSVLVILVGAAFIILAIGVPEEAAKAATRDAPFKIFLPFVVSGDCPPQSAQVFNAIGVLPPPTDRPAEQHADLNLALRGYIPTTGFLGLVDIGGPTDSNAPQLYGLFADNRTPTFQKVYQVYDWDWGCNCRGDPITDPSVSLVGMGVTAGEVVRVPPSGYNIGTSAFTPVKGVQVDTPDGGSGYEVLVLYANSRRITLKYTREDNVVRGYTIHVENVCVAPALLNLYNQWNAAGRAQLPALRAGQTFGVAAGSELGVVIRDNGSFMDPRSRKDWWKGR